MKMSFAKCVSYVHSDIDLIRKIFFLSSDNVILCIVI